MKKILLIALLLLPFSGFSQTKNIDGFLGIKFGSSSANVIAAVKAKGGALTKQDTVNHILYFTGLSLGHRPIAQLKVKFVKDKTFEGDLIFDTQLEAKAIGYYTDLQTDVTEIYGKGEAFKNFKDPYKEGDGNETLAISVGKADYVTYWTNTTDPKNTISLSILTNFYVKLQYQDAVLIEEAIAVQKAKEKGDF